jgi:anti-sigma B factor antagonist
MVQPAHGTDSDGARPPFEADGIRIHRVERGSSRIYQVAGEVDTLTAPHVDHALNEVHDGADTVSHVVLDLTDVPFLSSSGLSILATHHDRCRQHDITFSVVASHRATLRAIQITALDRIIPLYRNTSEALAADGSH